MDDNTVVLMPKWYTTAQVAQLLGFGLYKSSPPVSCAHSRTASIAASCPSGSTST